MNCSEIHKTLIDYADGNLSPQESIAIEEHMAICASCSLDLEQTRTLLGKFDLAAQQEPSSAVRDGFLAQLEEEKQLLATYSSPATHKEFPWKTAFQIAASVLLLVGGYMFGSFRESVKNNTQIVQLETQKEHLKQEMMLAMLENRSVSKRIQAVSYSEDMAKPDTEVLEALIDRLHFDGSVNVRLAAAEALSKYSNNENVKKAFIKSLTNDKNPNIQIAVIQFLVNIQDKRALAPMQQLLEQPETPDYVKEQVNVGLRQII